MRLEVGDALPDLLALGLYPFHGMFALNPILSQNKKGRRTSRSAAAGLKNGLFTKCTQPRWPKGNSASARLRIIRPFPQREQVKLWRSGYTIGDPRLCAATKSAGGLNFSALRIGPARNSFL
jgi:hypothetical protein